MLNHIRHSFYKGDTLIEVMFAVGIFGLAVVGAISLMNRGLATAQNTLEVTMARQEIDTQAEVLRFLQNAYISTKDTLSDDYCGNPKSYRDIWKCITSDKYTYAYDKVAIADPEFYTRSTEPGMNCDELFRLSGQTSFSIPDKSFILNPRTLGISDIDTSDPANAAASQQAITDRLKKIINGKSIVSTTGTYPRLIYNAISAESMSDATVDNANNIVTKDSQKNLTNAEGIWVTAVASEAGVECVDESSPTGKSIRPDYYDFHVQTCWDSVAGQIASTIGSTVRLFNPDQVTLSSKKNTLTFDNANWQEYGTKDDSGDSCKTCGCGTGCTACVSDDPSLYDNDHVRADTNTDGSVNVTFSGYTVFEMDEGIKHTIEGVNHFTLDMDIDTSKINTHPGGTLTISLGPVKAEIGAGGSVKISAGSQTQSETQTTFHLLLEKNGTAYQVCVGSICVSTTGSSSEATINYNFKHGSHACGCISKVYLTNIMMVNHDAGASIEDGDCVRYTLTPPPPDPEPEQTTHTLTLMANGGSFATGSITSATCTASGTINPTCDVTVPNTTPLSSTKIFQGWSTNPNATTPTYSAGSRISLNGDLSIYAVWKEPELENASVFIVTTWNHKNDDVDSFLINSSKSIRIFYGQKEQGNMVRLQDGTEVRQYNLDVDARLGITGKNYIAASDQNCGERCGDGYIEVVTMRNLEPATYQFYAHNYAAGFDNSNQPLSNINLTVRVYKGVASAGIGMFPKNTTPIATYKYDQEMRSDGMYSIAADKAWYVCDISITADAQVIVTPKRTIVSGQPR